MPLVLSGTSGISTNGTNWALQPQSAGYTLQPNVPCFFAVGNQGAPQSTGQVTPFNTALLNNGGYYNSSTYRFTAPVAGIYYFGLYGIMGPNAGGSATSHIRKNGVIQASMHRNITSDNTWEEGACFLYVSLAVGDYVDTYIGDGTLYLDLGNRYSGFSGQLIG